MDAVSDFLQGLQTVVFVGLGVAAVVGWLRHPDAARAWLAATFGSLAFITVVGVFVPEGQQATGAVRILLLVVIAVLALFPYLLFRFAGTFRRRAPAVEAAAAVVTAVAVVGAFALPVPEEGEPWSTTFTVWVILLLVQWVVLSGLVATELWTAGRGQPTVSRRRMQLLSAGSVGLALVLVLSAASGNDSPETTLADVVLQLLGIGAAPLFLLGFAPPEAVLARWRRAELADLRAAEEVLLQAQSPREVGERLLPHLTRIVGGRASALFDGDGTLLGVDGVAPEDAAAFFVDGRDPGSTITLPVRAGRLVVQVSPYTPYFAGSEAELLTRLATFTDLALSRAELSERERQTAVELQAANEAMREFLAIASHDLRTPVTVIKGFAATLSNDGARVDEAQREQYLATIRRHADHLGVIIDDLLTTSRLDAGVVEPNPTLVTLRPFVDRVATDLRDSLPTTVDVPADLVAWVDEEHLQRMLSNYLVNALRYGVAPVEIIGRRRDGMVELLVRDAGEGVPEAFHERLFEKFSRVDKRHSREKHGTGLGLAIVRGLARAGGGDAWYEHNVPKGACFGIRLPVRPPT
jgi:signal transduction histidine kinase